MEKKTAKWATLIICTVMGILSTVDDVERFSVYIGSPFVNRFYFHFFHVSFIHYAINAWCLLSIVFSFDTSVKMLLTAFVAASFVPVCWSFPTVGLSAVCFVLLGRYAFRVRDKVMYLSCLTITIGIGFIIPNVNGWIHLFCLSEGLIIGFLNCPLKWK